MSENRGNAYKEKMITIAGFTEGMRAKDLEAKKKVYADRGWEIVHYVDNGPLKSKLQIRRPLGTQRWSNMTFIERFELVGKVAASMIVIVVFVRVFHGEDKANPSSVTSTNSAQNNGEQNSQAPEATAASSGVTEAGADKAFERQMRDLLAKKFGGEKRWKLVVDPDDYLSISLNYTQMPDGLATVEHDTKMVAGFVMKRLVAKGRNPAEEMLSVFVYGQHPELGVTGQKVVRLFGKSYYDFNNDQLVWEAQ